MSKPAFGPASTPSCPVATRMPFPGGDWITTWSIVVSMSKSVVAVLGWLRSLFV